MKLIEKMADESLFTHPEYTDDDEGHSTCYETAFLAGFRKAREIIESRGNDLLFSKHELNEIAKIGEEEV